MRLKSCSCRRFYWLEARHSHENLNGHSRQSPQKLSEIHFNDCDWNKFCQFSSFLCFPRRQIPAAFCLSLRHRDEHNYCTTLEWSQRVLPNCHRLCSGKVITVKWTRVGANVLMHVNSNCPELLQFFQCFLMINIYFHSITSWGDSSETWLNSHVMLWQLQNYELWLLAMFSFLHCLSTY